jgi:DNA-binding transcriptional ArsR family regulator
VKPPPSADGTRMPARETASALARLLVLLGDESRLRIVLTLAQDGEATVAALAATVGQSRSNVSHNLSRLLLAGLVSCRPEGRNHFYQMEWGEFRDVLGRFFAEAGDAGREVHLGECSLAYRPGD